MHNSDDCQLKIEYPHRVNAREPRRFRGTKSTETIPVLDPSESVAETNTSAFLSEPVDAVVAVGDSPVGMLMAAILDTVEELGGIWTSGVVRGEDPPSAAAHITLDGKRYILILQPTDMVDRATIRAEKQ